MECDKCSKKTNQLIQCNWCMKTFCTGSCMINHFNEAHQDYGNIMTTFTSNKIRRKSSVVSSCFIKPGEFLKELKRDPYYSIENFEKVKLGKKTHQLGSGAFGDVYLVKHKKDGKFYAVKQMDKVRIMEACNKLDIVRKEIDIHSRLIHENIIRLYSYHEDKNSFFMIMEYANSGTLFSLIKKHKGLDEKRAFKYFVQTAAAINFIHDNNLIHRDIKPENLLLDDHDNIKLCDFGWCIELEIGNRTTFCGTIEYMAPEIIREEPYDKSIDMWSLGILLYELTHGYSPFRAMSGQEEDGNTEVFRNIIKNNFTFEKDISDDCKDLITKLISPNVQNRIKVKDIFNHPFIKRYENDFKGTLIDDPGNKSFTAKSSKHLNEQSNEIPLAKKMKKEISKEIEQNPLDNNLVQNASIDEILPNSVKNNPYPINEDSPSKLKENTQFSKEIPVKEAVANPEIDGKNIPNKHGDYSLFDCVLAQVGEKNKDKKKKRKVSPSPDLFDGNWNMNENNKIVMKFERVNMNKNNNINTSAKVATKEKCDYDFKMLKEAQDLDNQIEERYMKIDQFNSKKNDLSNQLVRNINEGRSNNIVKLYLDDDVFQLGGDKSQVKQGLSKKKLSTEVEDFNVKNDMNDKTIENAGNSFLLDKSELTGKRRRNKAKGLSGLDDSNYTQSHNFNDQLYINNPTRDSTKCTKTKPKDFSKELDISSVQKDPFYNEKPIEDNSIHLLAAIDILEKANAKKKEFDEEAMRETTFWEKFSDILSPFKCGK